LEGDGGHTLCPPSPHVTHGNIDMKPIGELQVIGETLEDLDKALS
jgi:hypothetical protein